ncbi:MAG: zf-TFIIB domain-containing protein [Tepidiformaceae bacterium]
MQCPHGHGELNVEHHQAIEVDHCPVCNGRWLDHHELDQLEATGAPDPGDRRGMIEYSKRASTLNCPACGKRMTAFNYRANALELDFCDDEHGYWLDGGEEGRVRDLIEERVRDLYRAASAEQSWGEFLGGLRNVGSKMRGRGRGRR